MLLPPNRRAEWRQKLRKAAALSLREWWVLGCAWGWLWVARLGLRFLALPTLMAWLEPRKPGREIPGGPSAAEGVAELVGIASRNCLLKPTCLERSLVLYRLLRGRGERARLIIGTSGAEGSFQAHAWVESGGRAFGATTQDCIYTPVVSFDGMSTQEDAV